MVVKKCKKCGKERRHYAKGLCHPCYQQKMNKKNPNHKESQNKYRRKYERALIRLKNKHKDEFKEIMTELGKEKEEEEE